MKRLVLSALLLTGAIALARAEPTVLLLDTAEVYCNDAWTGTISNGVSYQRAMAAMGQSFRLCRVEMIPLAGPTGNASAGWHHDLSSGQTSVWCRAKSEASAAGIRMRFALYGIAGEPTASAGCRPEMNGQLP